MSDVSSVAAAPAQPTAIVILAIDIVSVVVIGIAAAVFAPTAALLWGIVAAIGAAATIVLCLGCLGLSVGRLLLRRRSIDALTGLPSFRFAGPRRLVGIGTADDPFALVARPVSLPARPAADQQTEPPRVRLIVDDGTTHIVTVGAVIGRDPAAPPAPEYSLVAIPDLTRTVSRAHLLLTVGNDSLSITDIGSQNGTVVADTETQLIAHQTTDVPWGTRLLLGDRQIVLEHDGHMNRPQES